MAGAAGPGTGPGAAGGDGDDSLYPIAVLIDELRNEDVQVLKSGRGREASPAGCVWQGRRQAGSAAEEEARDRKSRLRSRDLTGRRGETREGLRWPDHTFPWTRAASPSQRPRRRPGPGGCGGHRLPAWAPLPGGVG